MSDVKRYDPTARSVLWRVRDGDYVKYEDYEALQVKLAEVDAERDNETIKRAGWELEAKTAQTALATARRDALEKAHRSAVFAGEASAGLSSSNVTDAICAAIRAIIAQEDVAN